MERKLRQDPLVKKAHLDMRRVDHSRKSGQATKGTRGMPWRQEAKKDVASCDKPREAAKQAVIRGFPNRETGRGSCPCRRR